MTARLQNRPTSAGWAGPLLLPLRKGKCRALEGHCQPPVAAPIGSAPRGQGPGQIRVSTSGTTESPRSSLGALDQTCSCLPRIAPRRPSHQRPPGPRPSHTCLSACPPSLWRATSLPTWPRGSDGRNVLEPLVPVLTSTLASTPAPRNTCLSRLCPPNRARSRRPPPPPPGLNSADSDAVRALSHLPVTCRLSQLLLGGVGCRLHFWLIANALWLGRYRPALPHPSQPPAFLLCILRLLLRSSVCHPPASGAGVRRMCPRERPSIREGHRVGGEPPQVSPLEWDDSQVRST